MTLYLDASAIVKLIQRESQSDGLRRYLRRHRRDEWVTSDLARVEVVRSVVDRGPIAVAHARRQLARLRRVALNRRVLDHAATLAPTTLLRSLDAIHIATAQLFGPDLRALVTYDIRMAQVATSLGVVVESPS